MLNKYGASIDPFQLLFVVCDLVNNHIAILEMLMVNHKDTTLQLVGYNAQKETCGFGHIYRKNL